MMIERPALAFGTLLFAGMIGSILAGRGMGPPPEGPPPTEGNATDDRPPPPPELTDDGLGQVDVESLQPSNFSTCVISGCRAVEYDTGLGYEPYSGTIIHQYGIEHRAGNPPRTPAEAVLISRDPCAVPDGQCTPGDTCILKCQTGSPEGSMFRGNDTVLQCDNSRHWQGHVNLCLRLTSDEFDFVREDISTCRCKAESEAPLFLCQPEDIEPELATCMRLNHDGSCPSIGCNYTYCTTALGKRGEGGSFWNFTVARLEGSTVFSLPASRGPSRYVRIKRGVIGVGMVMHDGICRQLDPGQDFRFEQFSTRQLNIAVGRATSIVSNYVFRFFDIDDEDRANPVDLGLSVGLTSPLEAPDVDKNRVVNLRVDQSVRSTPRSAYNGSSVREALTARGCDVSRGSIADAMDWYGITRNCANIPWMARCIDTGVAPYTIRGNNLPPGLSVNSSTGMWIGAPNVTGYFDQVSITITDFQLNRVSTNTFTIAVFDDDLDIFSPQGPEFTIESKLDGDTFDYQLYAQRTATNQDEDYPFNETALQSLSVQVLTCIQETNGIFVETEDLLPFEIRNRINRTLSFTGFGKAKVTLIGYAKILNDYTEFANATITATKPPILLPSIPIPEQGLSATELIFLIIGISILLIIIVAVYSRHGRKHKKAQLVQFTFPKADGFEYDRKNISMKSKLGEGAFGVVTKAFATDIRGNFGEILVAVKECKADAAIEDKVNFINESELMKRLDHPNVIRLLGVCMQEEPLLIITEFMAGGDLTTWMRGRLTVEMWRLVWMCTDVANGLGYLSSVHHFVHRDLACRNCLLDSKLRVKIADFGLSRAVAFDDYYRMNHNGKLPVRWMAPESLLRGSFTSASDIWSLGVVIWELMSFCEVPYSGMGNSEVFDAVVRNNLRLPKPVHCPLLVFEVCQKCWTKQPNRRPSAHEVAETLQTIALEMPGADVSALRAQFPVSFSDAENGYIMHGFKGNNDQSESAEIDLIEKLDSDEVEKYTLAPRTVSWSEEEHDFVKDIDDSESLVNLPVGEQNGPSGYSTVKFGETSGEAVAGYSTVKFGDGTHASLPPLRAKSNSEPGLMETSLKDDIGLVDLTKIKTSDKDMGYTKMYVTNNGDHLAI